MSSFAAMHMSLPGTSCRFQTPSDVRSWGWNGSQADDAAWPGLTRTGIQRVNCAVCTTASCARCGSVRLPACRGAHEAARVHHAARRRGGCVAAGGAGAAAGKLPTIGFLGASTPADCEPMGRRFCAAAARTRLDRGAQRSRSSIAGRRAAASAMPRSRLNSYGSRSMSSSQWESPCLALKAGDIGHPDRVCGGGRPGWQRPGRVTGAAGRQRHRIVDPVG